MSLDNIIWKIKKFFRNSVPYLVVLGALYGGHKLYKRGYFHRYLPTSVTRLLYKVPYFGSRFHHYQSSSGRSYSKSYAYGRKRHGKRKHRRHRRH